jgi:hypothetical protein
MKASMTRMQSSTASFRPVNPAADRHRFPNTHRAARRVEPQSHVTAAAIVSSTRPVRKQI